MPRNREKLTSLKVGAWADGSIDSPHKTDSSTMFSLETLQAGSSESSPVVGKGGGVGSQGRGGIGGHLRNKRPRLLQRDL